MGRIKTKQIKRLTKQLMREDNNGFTKSFEENKIAFSKLASTSSKKMRNVIAGYAARLVKEEEAKRV